MSAMEIDEQQDTSKSTEIKQRFEVKKVSFLYHLNAQWNAVALWAWGTK
jgi:hypothetical protein